MLLGVFYGCLIGVSVAAYIYKQRKQRTFYFGFIYVVLAIASVTVAVHASIFVHLASIGMVSWATLIAWVASCAENPFEWRAAVILPLCMAVLYVGAVWFAVWLMAPARAHGVVVTYVVLPVMTSVGLFLTYTPPGKWLWRQTGLKPRF